MVNLMQQQVQLLAEQLVAQSVSFLHKQKHHLSRHDHVHLMLVLGTKLHPIHAQVYVPQDLHKPSHFQLVELNSIYRHLLQAQFVVPLLQFSLEVLLVSLMPLQMVLAQSVLAVLSRHLLVLQWSPKPSLVLPLGLTRHEWLLPHLQRYLGLQPMLCQIQQRISFGLFRLCRPR